MHLRRGGLAFLRQCLSRIKEFGVICVTRLRRMGEGCTIQEFCVISFIKIPNIFSFQNKRSHCHCRSSMHNSQGKKTEEPKRPGGWVGVEGISGGHKKLFD